MKVLWTFVCICATLLAISSPTSAQRDESYYYSSRYDNIDVNNIFRSRLLNHYVDCLLDKKPCPPEGKDLKRVLPDALKTRCGRCSKIQKEKSLDVITRLYYQHPKLYTALAERYDPTGEYTRNFERWFDDQNALKPQPIYRQRQSDERDLQEVRRSPSSSSFQSNSNNLPTERRRIPATTTTEPTTTTRRITSTRATLRTTTATVRTTTQRQEQPRFFEEVAPVFRTAPVAPPLPTYTAPPSPIFTAPLTSRPIFREPPRAQPVTTTRSPIIRFQPPAVVREFPVTQGTQESTFRQSNVFNESPRQPVRPTQGTSVFRESTATPQYVTASQRFAPAEENSRPSVIFREATTSRSQPDPTPIVRDQSNSFEREPTAVTNPPKTSNVVPASDPQVFRSREREQSSDSPSVRPSVPVRDSPVYRPQTNFQANQRTPIFRNPTAAVPNSPSREQPPNQEVRNFSRDSEAISGRNEPVSIDNEPDLIDRFFVPDGNARFRRSETSAMFKS